MQRGQLIMLCMLNGFPGLGDGDIGMGDRCGDVEREALVSGSFMW